MFQTPKLDSSSRSITKTQYHGCWSQGIPMAKHCFDWQKCSKYKLKCDRFMAKLSDIWQSQNCRHGHGWPYQVQSDVCAHVGKNQISFSIAKQVQTIKWSFSDINESIYDRFQRGSFSRWVYLNCIKLGIEELNWPIADRKM